MMICEGFLTKNYDYCEDCHKIIENVWEICPNSKPHEHDDWCREGGGRGLSDWDEQRNTNVNCHKHHCIQISKLEYEMKKILKEESK